MNTLAVDRSISPSPDDRLLRVREAAELLGCSERLIHKLASAGDLPRVKLGRAARFRLSDLRGLIEKGAA